MVRQYGEIFSFWDYVLSWQAGATLKIPFEHMSVRNVYCCCNRNDSSLDLSNVFTSLISYYTEL